MAINEAINTSHYRAFYVELNSYFLFQFKHFFRHLCIIKKENTEFSQANKHH